jgi:hypothetical protein
MFPRDLGILTESLFSMFSSNVFLLAARADGVCKDIDVTLGDGSGACKGTKLKQKMCMTTMMSAAVEPFLTPVGSKSLPRFYSVRLSAGLTF